MSVTTRYIYTYSGIGYNMTVTCTETSRWTFMEEFGTQPTFWLPNFVGASVFPFNYGMFIHTAAAQCTQVVAASISSSLGEAETHGY